MQEIGRGAKVFDAAPVRGRFLPMEGPDDVLGAHGHRRRGRRRAGARRGRDVPRADLPRAHRHHLHERHLRSHIGIVSREFQVPCVMALHLRRRRAGRRRRGRARLLRRRGGGPWLTHETPVDTANRLIAYHAPISKALTQERTSLESALIPVTAYIVVACAESYLRYPEMMRAHRRGHAGRGDRSPGPAPGLPGRPLLPVVDRQLLPARPQDHGDGRPRRATTPRARRRSSTSGSGPRSPTAATAPARRGTPGTSRIYDDDTVAALLDGAVPDRRRRAPGRGEALQRHARQPPVPALLRHPGRLRRHRAVRGARRSPGRSLLVRDFYRLGRRRLPVVRRRQGRAVPPPHRRARARRRAEHVHRLRHVEPHARGLPRPPRRLRPLHHRRPAARASCGPCRPTSTTTSSPPCARRRPSTTATSPPWTATRRSAPAPTCTSASSARSPRSPAWPTSSTGPCPATCPSRSTSSCRRCRARTPASPRTRPTTSSTRRMPP